MKKLFLSFLSFFLLIFLSSSSQAATITPTTFDDFYDGAICSLRNAVESFNIDMDFGGCVNMGDAYGVNDTIVLQAGTYNLSLGPNSNDTNISGDLDFFSTAQAINMIGAGPDQTIVDASGIPGGDRAFHFLQIVDQVTLTDLSITGGDVVALGQNGGGILANTQILNLNNVQIRNNLANSGGGLALSCSANIVDSVIELNEAQESMPGLGIGGGIYWFDLMFCNADIVVNIDNSQLLNNIAETQAGGISIESPLAEMRMQMANSTVDSNVGRLAGGGIFIGGLASAAIDSSTISRNAAPQGVGGGINDSGEFLFLTNSTVSENIAQENGGGINSVGNILSLFNVTIAFNQLTDPLGLGGGIARSPALLPPFEAFAFNSLIANNSAAIGPDCSGPFSSEDNNLIGNIGAPGECLGFDGLEDQVGLPASPIDPQLGPLQLNGGSTETHALAFTSPAVDRGNSVTGCQTLDVALFFQTGMSQLINLVDDQRFLPRPVAILDPANPICDIGAYELQALDFTVGKDDGLGGNSVELNDSFTYSIVLSNNGTEAVTGVTLEDPLPPQVSFVSVNTTQGNCSEAASVVTCDIGEIAAGSSVTVTITVLAVAVGQADNTVTATANNDEFSASESTIIGGVFLQGSGCYLNRGEAGPGALMILLFSWLAVKCYFLRLRQRTS